MEFWGVEVKAGEPLKVELEVGRVLHLSQACLGEVKKDKGHESVYLFVNVDDKKLVLGTLTPEKLPQQIFDLVFDKDFELTHNWKNGSVFFYGYIANNPYEDLSLTFEDEDSSDSESDEDIPVIAPNVGVPSTQVKQEKPATAENANVVKDSAAGKQKVKIVEPNKDMKTDDDEDSDSDSSYDEDAMSTDDSDDVEDTKDGFDEDDDDDSDEEDEQTPQKVQPSKKRAMESAKTPVTDKKAKLVTPQKTDGKKGIVHVATPHPSKQAGKTPANKSNQQTPKSEGSHSCKSCNRWFKSENALDSHNKAKHTAGK